MEFEKSIDVISREGFIAGFIQGSIITVVFIFLLTILVWSVRLHYRWFLDEIKHIFGWSPSCQRCEIKHPQKNLCYKY